MRYDATVKLYYKPKPVFNYETGEYDNVEPVIITRMANVNTLGEDRKALLYGKVEDEVVIARFIGRVDKPEYFIIETPDYQGIEYRVSRLFHHRREWVLHGVMS